MLIPAVENSVSGRRYRPGDVFTSRKGLTVEIGNTDAEGRLVLADALAAGGRRNARLLIDIATLTGAARVATGMELPPFFTDDETLAADLLAACARRCTIRCGGCRCGAATSARSTAPSPTSTTSQTTIWRGAITAALFLNRFVTARKIAGCISIFPPGSTGPKPGRRKGAEANAARALYALLKERYGA